MNGKSGNMNNVLAQIYPTGCFIPGDEVIAVFDADQVPCHIPDTCASGQARQWPRPAAVHGLLRRGMRILARMVAGAGG